MGALYTQEFGGDLTGGVLRMARNSAFFPHAPPLPRPDLPRTTPGPDPALQTPALALDSALTPGAVRPPAQVSLSDLHGDFRLAARRRRRRDAARGWGDPLNRRILPGPGLALPRDP